MYQGRDGSDTASDRTLIQFFSRLCFHNLTTPDIHPFAHSRAKKKIAELGTQLTQAEHSVGNLKQEFTELSDADWRSGYKIDPMRNYLEQAEGELREIWKRAGKIFPGFLCLKMPACAK
jgi:hypothetical protein